MKKYIFLVVLAVLASMPLTCGAAVLERFEGVWLTDKAIFLAKNPELKKSYETDQSVRDRLDKDFDGRGLWINAKDHILHILNYKDKANPYSRGRADFTVSKESVDQVELASHGQVFVLRLLPGNILEFYTAGAGEKPQFVEYYTRQRNFPTSTIKVY